MRQRQHDERTLAGPNDRLRGDEQCRPRSVAEIDRGEHARAQAPGSVGKFDPHGERPAFGGDAWEDRGDAAGKALARIGGEGRGRALARAKPAGHRLRHRGIEPHRTEPIHLGECLTARDRHPGPDAERLDRAAGRRRDRHHIMRSPAPLDCGDRSGGHAQQEQALTGRASEAHITDPPDGQIFRLCARPFRHQYVGERGACPDHIARRARIDPLDEAASSRLDDGDVALVELDRTGRREARSRRARSRLRDAQAKRLRAAWVDRHAGLAARRFVGIFGDKLHIHERRFARLVEMLARDHRIVPVEDLASALRCCSRRRLMAPIREAIAEATRRECERRGGHAQLRARACVEFHWLFPPKVKTSRTASRATSASLSSNCSSMSASMVWASITSSSPARPAA